MVQRRESPDDLLSRIESDYEDGAFDKVAQELQRGLELYPDHLTFLEWDAVLCNDEGRYKEALDALEAVLEAEPDRPFALREKAVSLRNLGRFAEALELYLRVGPETELDGAYEFDLGHCRERLGQGELAERHFLRAAELEPETYSVPRRFADGELEALVRKAVAQLPREFQRRLALFDFVFEDYPEPLEPNPFLFGKLDRPLVPVKSPQEAAARGKFYIYRRNFELELLDSEALEQELLELIAEEMADAFGLEEDLDGVF
jgi:tetratricopeptide (TPR) repeat protein